jgi:hypothetical protein
MISVVINCDNREGYKNNKSHVGEFGVGSLQGVRSIDLLTEGVKNKMNYFRGYDTQCILYIDKHESLSDELFNEISELVNYYGNNSKLVIKEHDRNRYRWNDYIILEALKLADGEYVAHFDQDCNAFRVDNSNIIDKYLFFLEQEYKYICQPSSLTFAEHGMFWASTRFFICKRETLDIPLLENSMYSPFMGVHTPCLEHILGVMAGNGKVLYPPREDEKYIVFSWVKYYAGTLKKLNDMPQEEALKYVINLGVCGPNDVNDKQ